MTPLEKLQVYVQARNFPYVVIQSPDTVQMQGPDGRLNLTDARFEDASALASALFALVEWVGGWNAPDGTPIVSVYINAAGIRANLAFMEQKFQPSPEAVAAVNTRFGPLAPAIQDPRIEAFWIQDPATVVTQPPGLARPLTLSEDDYARLLEVIYTGIGNGLIGPDAALDETRPVCVIQLSGIGVRAALAAARRS